MVLKLNLPKSRCWLDIRNTRLLNSRPAGQAGLRRANELARRRLGSSARTAREIARRPRPATRAGESMNKADLIDRISAGAGITKSQAASAVETSVASITGALKKGERVALVGFG